MIEEIYVDFEIAKILKELNFDINNKEKVIGFSYNHENKVEVTEFYYEKHTFTNYFLRPTIFTVVQWLYEIYGVWITVNYDCGWEWRAISVVDKNKVHFIWKEGKSVSYDFAYLDAIKETLKELKK